jgi:four helix bundle protein
MVFMARIERFEDLLAWQEARRLVGMVYEMTRRSEWASHRSLADQLERAAVSAMSNVAEGFERPTNADKVRLLSVARASCGEVRSQLYIAEDLKLLSSDVADRLRLQTISVGKLISGLIQHLKP